ncbi:MAG: type II secretion system F family protein [Lentisphaerae bacterium]|nr:type II secretion system F family protein [Lentisphaerota bacterium]
MPTFTYTARSRTGEKVEGVVEVADRREVLRMIEQQGNVPVFVSEKSIASKQAQSSMPVSVRSRQKRKMKTREVLIFTTELSDLLASGMTLGKALNCLANRKTGGAADRIIAALRDDIIQGSSLSDSLARHPETFPNLYTSMIKAGEAGGAIDEILRRLVDHYERIQETKEKVIMALVYPCIVMLMGFVTMFFSMVYVIPKFKVVFEQLGDTLPLPTQILISSSEWLVKYGWLAVIGIATGLIILGRAIRSGKGKLWWDGAKLRMPLIKGVVASGIYANFARTLRTLLANGVPVLQSLAIVERTVGNDVIARELRKAKDRVTDGTTISGPLSVGKVFPPMMIDMLTIGEETGDIAGSLGHIAKRYESELDRNLKIFTTALEPILIVIVALMVGFVAISILLAVFDLSSGLNV